MSQAHTQTQPKIATLQNAQKNNHVALAPHTDAWMQGDRYGAIQTPRVNGDILVRLDK